MRKLLLGFTMLTISQFGFSQAISEYAIIPVSVTLNSVFRLTVVSGGNIEWVVNTIDQYTSGIPAGSRYETTFTVSSSLDYQVNMRAEDAQLNGQDNPGNPMNLNNIGYKIRSNGTALVTVPAVPATDELIIPYLTTQANANIPKTAGELIITGVANRSAGNAVKNNFTVEWRLGTHEPGGNMNALTLLQQSIPADRYITNIFLELQELP